MAQISFVYVVCADCGAELDRIEHDDQPASAVVTVAQQLGVDLEAAAKLVAKHNPGAQHSSEVNAKALALAIVQDEVDGYPAPTCPADPEHTGRKTSTTSPTPIVSTRLAREAAL